MQAYNVRMTPKVHVLIHHVPKYVSRTGVPLGPSSEQALGSQRTQFPVFRERTPNAVLQHNSFHL